MIWLIGLFWPLEDLVGVSMTLGELGSIPLLV